MSRPDELWREWKDLDRSLGEADERAHKEAGGADLYKARAAELLAPICDRMDEIEEQIAAMVPATIHDCLAQIRLLKANWHMVPGEREDLIIDHLLAGLEAMAAGGG
jgi:hypothetical protein